ncbi:MAG TPA: STELLO glycosyltransferase family protein [Bacillota bacterium]|nr:STELLO glycosyltransferase family protein [Bacillota bacterium]HOL10541.1 STELLO glycosyltransferase family protein [Bacillota bacterium]HPO98267.1 STELLO glycosyltransferase family protein [Bacillota bacterium]
MENGALKRTIVITTIYQPSKAVQLYSQQEEYSLIVVGDLKTPSDWHYDDSLYLSVEYQKKWNSKLVSSIPWNHYSRKMIGYLYAIQAGAEIIVDTDDDNIPLPNWGFPDFEGSFNLTEADQGFVNVYSYFGTQSVWPRGLPLTRIRQKVTDYHRTTLKVSIWQGLANEDPDVDAIFRLTRGETIFFQKRRPLILAPGTLCPFNSQNTLFTKEVFPLLYLPTTTTFRFTDILRSFVAQPILWANDLHLGFCSASVYQRRNAHNLQNDFVQELPGYLFSEMIPDWVAGVISSNASMVDNLYNAYECLVAKGIVLAEEMPVLECWLESI